MRQYFAHLELAGGRDKRFAIPKFADLQIENTPVGFREVLDVVVDEVGHGFAAAATDGEQRASARAWNARP